MSAVWPSSEERESNSPRSALATKGKGKDVGFTLTIIDRLPWYHIPRYTVLLSESRVLLQDDDIYDDAVALFAPSSTLLEQQDRGASPTFFRSPVAAQAQVEQVHLSPQTQAETLSGLFWQAQPVSLLHEQALRSPEEH